MNALSAVHWVHAVHRVHLSRTRQAQASGRLRPVELRIDEVALEMRGQHARRSRRAARRGPWCTAPSNAANCSGVQATDVGQNAVTPYFGRIAATRATALVVVEHIDALDTVDVHVDETRHET